MDNTTPNLHVYKASAGSGKTHRLTGEYLRLLFSSAQAYRHILAVTFTNKATDEMKTRIVDELANLSANKKSDYLTQLTLNYNLSEPQVRAKAKDILVRILHDYSAFTVSTIDKFFQQTMRAFTREIGLGGGYNVELDTHSVLNEAIDSMLFDLERNENKQLLEWLIRFSEEKVENGKTWNIRSDIQSLSTEIFKESYKAYSHQVRADIEDKELINNYKEMLRVAIREFEQTSKNIAERALNIILRFGLSTDDFKGSSRSPFKSFEKWANRTYDKPTATFQKLVDQPSNWYTKTAPSAVVVKIDDAYPELNECVREITEHYAHSADYQTAYEINRFFFTLGILGDIDSKIREYTAENNIMLITDTTELLNRIIEGNETPFIYEKVGTYTRNYMIDEFQDTSGMQWNNFYPLVKDSLAAGERNFIVGDVKQSIYRWRNSDWKLLDEHLDKVFEQEGIKHETLDTNWRSDANIINFNNAIFTQGAQLLQDTYNEGLPNYTADERLLSLSTRITKAYGEIYQTIPPTKPTDNGHVKLQFVDTAVHNWEEYVLEQLPYQIEELQDKGYKLKDIAILVRTKREGVDVAHRLLTYKSMHPASGYKYDIISDEALYIGSATSIKLIVSLLKYMQNPEDATLRTLAIYEYLKFHNQLTAESALQEYFSTETDLPEDIKTELRKIQELPLYEMTEELFELFYEAMDSNEQVYIQSFLDMVLDYTIRKSSDLESFLTWWDEVGIQKTVFTPDGQDAIRIMTIHKSKGLGFNVVLLPFCDWSIDHTMLTILWCRPQVPPFNQLHLVPVRYNKKLVNTIFSYEYYDEQLQAFIDNLNILYVAFTRAKNTLIVYAPKPNKAGVTNVASLLWQCVNQSVVEPSENKTYINLSTRLNEETSILELGANTVYTPKAKEAVTIEIEVDAQASVSYEERLQLSLTNKYYFGDSGQRDYGTLMHHIVSKIHTLADIEWAVNDYHIQGNITSNEVQEIVGQLENYLSNPIVADWYSGNYIILNEVAILQPTGGYIRPDRVMIKEGKVTVIDYKFGEHESAKYVQQVKRYMTEIAKIGYENIEGYICYMKMGKVVRVS